MDDDLEHDWDVADDGGPWVSGSAEEAWRRQLAADASSALRFSSALHDSLSDLEGLVDELTSERLQFLAISPRLRNAFRHRMLVVRSRIADAVQQLCEAEKGGPPQ